MNGRDNVSSLFLLISICIQFYCQSDNYLIIMSWKNSLGQFIGIFVGVTLGATAVSMLMGGSRRPPPQQQPYVEQNIQQRSAGLFDQAVANIQPRPSQ